MAQDASRSSLGSSGTVILVAGALVVLAMVVLEAMAVLVEEVVTVLAAASDSAAVVDLSVVARLGRMDTGLPMVSESLWEVQEGAF